MHKKSKHFHHINFYQELIFNRLICCHFEGKGLCYWKCFLPSTKLMGRPKPRGCWSISHPVQYGEARFKCSKYFWITMEVYSNQEHVISGFGCTCNIWWGDMFIFGFGFYMEFVKIWKYRISPALSWVRQLPTCQHKVNQPLYVSHVLTGAKCKQTFYRWPKPEISKNNTLHNNPL